MKIYQTTLMDQINIFDRVACSSLLEHVAQPPPAVLDPRKTGWQSPIQAAHVSKRLGGEYHSWFGIFEF
jgi:hypothetical protein